MNGGRFMEVSGEGLGDSSPQIGTRGGGQGCADNAKLKTAKGEPNKHGRFWRKKGMDKMFG